jgi:hypothetical protein
LQDTGESATLSHAWFSAGLALRIGSSVYRKPSGSRVNVTRLTADRVGKGSTEVDEKYVGEVIRQEDGGCVQAASRVRGITEQGSSN